MVDTKDPSLNGQITFARLPEIEPTEIERHMSNPRMADHMPLLTTAWNAATVARFVAAKEACWARDGLGHWAILHNDRYVGWGGFQKEGDEWDFGLVLKPDAFGLGRRITAQALAFARSDHRIPFVTFLLPPSRKKLAALDRLGAVPVGQVDYDGARFLKFRLETE
ncbi:GNAT family N-acetyltransferase [Roseovarius atlanticus]|nr:GNAT family N-acetyltransferase [Roseovarius atlanticus]MBY6122953.1 GNAT family N-acetyltransferase [Roseovarius atlanticus]MBY6147449.1 GNAT family N-acetyltransferase [Roseovarius atlanticus]